MPACPTHPSEALLGSCERCGDFVCGRDSRFVAARRLCLRCAPLVEADWVERYRRELWGKADDFVALFGVVLPLAELVWIFGFRPHPLHAAFGAGFVAISIAYLLRRRWARLAMFLIPVSLLGLSLTHQIRLGPTLGVVGVPAILIAAAYFSPRNRLAFKLPVADPQVRKLWDVYRNNPRAREALACSLLGLLFPILLPIGLVLGIYALRRVDPDADPPIGKRPHAVTAIALSLLGIGFWALAMAGAIA